LRVLSAALEAASLLLLGVLLAIPALLAVLALRAGECGLRACAAVVLLLLMAAYGLVEYHASSRGR